MECKCWPWYKPVSHESIYEELHVYMYTAMFSLEIDVIVIPTRIQYFQFVMYNKQFV